MSALHIKASSDGVLYGATPNGDLSNITNVVGTIVDGQSVSISGINFTTKSNPKPLLYWTADGGELPSLLGRTLVWDASKTFDATISLSVVAPGSSQSYYYDHGAAEGDAIGRVGILSSSAYMFRKTYEDFDITTDYARVTEINTEVGVLSQGDTVTGSISGATGVVQKVITAYEKRWIYYEKTGGTINDPTPIDFVVSETLTGPLGSATNIQPDGLFRTFNFKTTRFWRALATNENNVHLNSQGRDNNLWRITPEYTGATLWNEFWDNPLTQNPGVWQIEEFEYKISGVGINDGIFRYYQDGLVSSKQDDFMMRDVTHPDQYELIVQSQVSNGAQPNSNMHYDCIYIDDTWHRVIISSAALSSNIVDGEVQIPSTWSDDAITITLRGVDALVGQLYLYVFNSVGVSNAIGYPL